MQKISFFNNKFLKNNFFFLKKKRTLGINKVTGSPATFPDK